jgi:cation diffusion facilitator family transporter
VPAKPAISRTRRTVYVSLAVAVLEAAAVAVTAVLTGSSAVVAQALVNFADVGVQVFLVIGVVASARAADASHPLGYGRERFFWSLFAAIGIFVGGCAVAFEEAFRTGVHPGHVKSFALGYAILGVTVVLDGAAYWLALRSTRAGAAARGLSVRVYLRRTTEPATTTELLGNGIGIVGALLALGALVITQLTGSALADAVASGLIGLALVSAAFILITRNRALLTGRGISPAMLDEMRDLIGAQPGVLDVADLFAVVVGPNTLVVNGDLTFDDDLTVPAVETAIECASAALKERWPAVAYVYLTPVASRRPRGAHGPPRGRAVRAPIA